VIEGPSVKVVGTEGNASQTLLAADMQRYFRDVNVLHQQANIQPSSSNELYGRFLAGLAPNSDVL
jgi:3-hydroxy-9,10-secoandrosta-1,3,5(10)-triene-9,17-dione monooxygenase